MLTKPVFPCQGTHCFKTVLLSLSFSHTEGTCSWIGVSGDYLGQGSPLESGNLITAAQLSFTLVMHAVDYQEWYYVCHQFFTHSPLDYLPQQRDHDTTTYPGEKGRKKPHHQQEDRSENLSSYIRKKGSSFRVPPHFLQWMKYSSPCGYDWNLQLPWF